jgi:hypothetical protein
MRATQHNGAAYVAVLCAILLGCAATAVQARGNGIKAGSGRLHFGVDLELTFDSNPGYFPSGHENHAADLMLRTRPKIGLEFPSDTVSFELNGGVGYDYFFGVDNSRTTDLSAISGEADMRLGFNPEGQFAFFLIDNFSRSADPRYTSLSGRFDRTSNEAKALFQIRPGGGALMFDVAYGFYLDWFDETNDPDYNAKALSNYSHRVYFSGKWKFLPKTALSLDFDADLRRYPYQYQQDIQNPDVNAIRATVGLIGQISPSLALVVKAGYGDSLLEGGTTSAGAAYAGGDYRSAVGHAELSYRAATTFLQVGYSRGFEPVMLFAYFGQDRLYARFHQQLFGRFSLSADLGFDFLDYGRPLADDSEGRFDYFLSGGAAFEYHILDWLLLALDYRFQALFSDYQQPLTGAGGVEYNRHAVTFRVGLDY